MIPRFNYSFSLIDAWDTLKAVTTKRATDTDALNALFPQATYHYVDQARVGIFYALQAFGLAPGSLVGVQPYTCSSVLSAIDAAGHRPLFIDINDQLTIDCDDLQRKLARLDALIVTHTFGTPANVRRIRQLVDDLPVIEDCAHAFLSYYEGTHVGNFFDCAVFSFGDGKFPSFGTGGLLVVNTPIYAGRIANLLSELPEPGLLNELTLIGKRIVKAALHSRAGSTLQQWLVRERAIHNRNSVVPGFPNQCRQPSRSVAYKLQKHFDRIVKQATRQRGNARFLFEQNKSTVKLLTKSGLENAFTVVLLDDNQDSLYHHLRATGIGAGRHFQHSKVWARQFGYQPEQCPHFEQLVDNVLTIPCHYGLTQRDLKIISQRLRRFASPSLFIHEERIDRY